MVDALELDEEWVNEVYELLQQEEKEQGSQGSECSQTPLSVLSHNDKIRGVSMSKLFRKGPLSPASKRERHREKERQRFQRLNGSINGLRSALLDLSGDDISDEKKLALGEKVNVVTEARETVERLRSQLESLRLFREKKCKVVVPDPMGKPMTHVTAIRFNSGFTVGDMATCFQMDSIPRLVIRPDGTFLTWNESFEKMARGLMKDGLAQQTIWSVSLKADYPDMMDCVSSMIRGQKVINRSKYLLLNGELVYCYMTSSIIYDKSGSIQAIACSFIEFPKEMVEELKVMDGVGPLSPEVLETRKNFFSDVSLDVAVAVSDFTSSSSSICDSGTPSGESEY